LTVRGMMVLPVFEGAFFLCFAPEDLVVAVGVEGRVDIDEVDTFIGELFQLVEVVAAIDDTRIEEGRWFGGLCSSGRA